MTIKKKSLVEETIARLLEIITVEKAFEAGERLPNEVKLAASLNIGRSTLRESIAYLKEKGILESKKGSGTYVVDSNANLTTVIKTENKTFKLREVIEFRLALEPYAVMVAIKRASTEELQAILEQGEKVCDCIVKSVNRIEEEQKFHEFILQSTHNNLFIQQIPTILQSISDVISSKQSIGKLATDTEMDIQSLMEAFRQRDAIIAKNAMEIHLHHVVEALKLNNGKYKLY